MICLGKEINNLFLDSMPDIWIRQACVQGFYYETSTLKSVNMFERMEIAEYIYEGVVENSYKIPTREDTNCYSHSRKKREFPTSSKTYSETNKSSVKLRKRYVDHLKYRPKLTCLIHGPGHSSYECKFLGDFGYKYSKSRPTKYCRQDPAKMKKCKRQKENNSISQHAVD